MRNLFILLAGMVLLGSCNSSYEKTKSGLRYKIFKGNGGEKLKVGQFIKMNQAFLIPEKDTVLYSTYGKMPGYAKIDTGMRTYYTFLELLPKCSVGDSLVIVFSIDTLIKRQMIPVTDFNDVFRRGGMLTCRMKITKVYNGETEVMADIEKDKKIETDRQMKEMQANSQKEISEMEDYMKKNKIQAIKTPSGAYVQVTERGTGPVGDTGATAQVFYTGKLLKDGTTFDSNIDPKFQHTEAYPVPLGMGTSVKGFDEGLMYFGKGGKGRIFIPSFLGYGKAGRQPSIPPDAALVFDVEVRDVTPKQAIPAPPAGAPGKR